MKLINFEKLSVVDIEIKNCWQKDVPILKHRALGSHIILDFFNCATKSMSDTELIQKKFRTAAQKAFCTIVAECYHTFEPHGVSGVTVISESHFTYHGWDEHKYAAIDLFYCGEHVEILNAIEYLVDFFNPSNIKIYSFPRGNALYN